MSDYCKATVSPPGSFRAYGCSRKATKGGYCLQHWDKRNPAEPDKTLWFIYVGRVVKIQQVPATEKPNTWEADGQRLRKEEVMSGYTGIYGESLLPLLEHLETKLVLAVEKAGETLRSFRAEKTRVTNE